MFPVCQVVDEEEKEKPAEETCEFCWGLRMLDPSSF
jgi:hypothetical protein